MIFTISGYGTDATLLAQDLPYEAYLPVALRDFSGAFPSSRPGGSSPTATQLSNTPGPTRTPNPAIELPSTDLYAHCIVQEIVDREANGNADEITKTWYTANGNPKRAEYDFDANGKAEGATIWTYLEDGTVVKVEYDNEIDGTIDFVRTFQYNLLNRVTSTEEDSPVDGRTDRRVIFEYNPVGWLVAMKVDRLADSVIDTIHIYDYDSLGRLISVSEDNDGDGISDITTTQIWSGEHLVRVNWDIDNDGVIDGSEAYDYDGQNRRVRKIWDFDQTGEPLQWNIYRYNDRGLLEQWDHWLKGPQWEETGRRTYDGNSRPLFYQTRHHALPGTDIEFRNDCP